MKDKIGDRMSDETLTRRIAQVADATGEIVMVGSQGHKREWFARCGRTEFGGSTPREALEAVVAALAREAERVEHDAAVAARGAAAIRALVSD